MNGEKLKQLIETHPGKVHDLKKQITQFMKNQHGYPSDWCLYQKAHHELYRQGSKQPVKCPVCQKFLKFIGLKKGYPKNCSYKCRAANPDTLKEYKKTCMDNWGSEYASQNSEFRAKVKQTCINNWGVENPAQTSQVQDKIKKTNQKLYGCDNVSQSKIVLEKIKKIKIQRGSLLDDSQRSEIEKYRLAVAVISKKSYHDHFYKINPDQWPRGRYQWHLDHIFSVEEGFKNRIPPEVIGHWTNLRMLWHLDNIRKNIKCHKTIEQLFEDYRSNR